MSSPETLKQLTYTVKYSPEDEVFVARVGESLSLAAHGPSPAAAMQELQTVVLAETDALAKATNIVQVILVNGDVKMGKGKIAGQVAHAVARLERDTEAIRDKRHYALWVANDETKIVKKTSEANLVHALATFMLQGAREVRDAGKTQVPAGTLTAVALPPLPKNEIPEWIQQLPLL